ncbi:MAG: hypothetical protein HY851_04910, partial [candidate division Zixibacteria bacterium]|nr:hypothetical protein [candidate division Zixibacteria bacterium]
KIRIKRVGGKADLDQQIGELDTRKLAAADKAHIEQLVSKIMSVFRQEQPKMDTGAGQLMLEVDIFDQGIMQKAVVPAEHGHGADKTLDLVEELEHDVAP